MWNNMELNVSPAKNININPATATASPALKKNTLVNFYRCNLTLVQVQSHPHLPRTKG